MDLYFLQKLCYNISGGLCSTTARNVLEVKMISCGDLPIYRCGEKYAAYQLLKNGEDRIAIPPLAKLDSHSAIFPMSEIATYWRIKRCKRCLNTGKEVIPVVSDIFPSCTYIETRDCYCYSEVVRRIVAEFAQRESKILGQLLDSVAEPLHIKEKFGSPKFLKECVRHLEGRNLNFRNVLINPLDYSKIIPMSTDKDLISIFGAQVWPLTNLSQGKVICLSDPYKTGMIATRTDITTLPRDDSTLHIDKFVCFLEAAYGIIRGESIAVCTGEM